MASIYYQTVRGASGDNEADNYISSFSISLNAIDEILNENLKGIDKIKW